MDYNHHSTMPKVQNVQNDCSQPDVKTDVQPDVNTDIERLQPQIDAIKTAQRILQEDRVREKLSRMKLA